MALPQNYEIISSKVKQIKDFFARQEKNTYVYENQIGNRVTCKTYGDGVQVTCLGNYPKLPWGVFYAAIEIMVVNGGSARNGNAHGFQLGSDGLPLDSVEGYVASMIYGKNEGDIVYRRISPISYILIASGVCSDKAEPGTLKLS